MKSKKLLSTAVAGMLVAAQMVMPVVATDGGTVDVDVTTTNVVIRVEVPTSLEIAVNQFEKGDEGSQIYSTVFDIKNKSEIPVKVAVTSTATLDSAKPIGLVGTKAEAEASTAEDGEAWLAIAALTSAGKYTEESGKDIKDLTEANKNVETFVQGADAATKDTATAKQTFYLDADRPAAPGADVALKYTKVAPADADGLAAAKKISYVQFYELESIATPPTDDATLQAEVDKGDVIAIDANDVVTVYKKGTASVTWATGTFYNFKTPDTPTAVTSLATGKVYIYGETVNTASDAVAGFRYIGKLSDKETWTKADIKKVSIAYDIKGVTTTKYDELAGADSIEYGLYTGDGAGNTPSIDYTNATAINLIKGASAVYANYSDLGFADTDVTACKVKVDSADYADITKVASTTALKFNIDNAWNTATSVKIYVVTSTDVYVYTFK